MLEEKLSMLNLNLILIPKIQQELEKNNWLKEFWIFQIIFEMYWKLEISSW